MKNQEFKKWENLAKKILDDCWKFRRLCDKPFDRGFIGELLVLKQLLNTYKTELCSTLENKIIYAGSANKKWDFELKLNRKTIQIDSKATTIWDQYDKPKWVRQKGANFCNVKFKKVDSRGFKQDVSLESNYDKNFFYVFVDAKAWMNNRKAQFFTLSDKEAKSTLGGKYKKHHNKEIRRSETTDLWVEYKDIKDFRDQHFRKLLK